MKVSPDKLKEIDKEIALFEQWFREQGNSPLARYELAMLRAYAYFLRFFKPQQNEPSAQSKSTSSAPKSEDT